MIYNDDPEHYRKGTSPLAFGKGIDAMLDESKRIIIMIVTLSLKLKIQAILIPNGESGEKFRNSNILHETSTPASFLL